MFANKKYCVIINLEEKTISCNWPPNLEVYIFCSDSHSSVSFLRRHPLLECHALHI